MYDIDVTILPIKSTDLAAGLKNAWRLSDRDRKRYKISFRSISNDLDRK